MEVTGHGREVCHRFINESGRSMRVRLLAVVRPFQVTPPWQHFRNVGGVSPIHELSWLDGVVSVNGTAKLRSATAGGYWGGMAFDEGCVCEPLIRGELPVRQTVIDGLGYASGVLAHDFRVHAGDEVETVLQRFGFEEPESDDTSFWRETLPCGQLRGHGWAEDVAKTQLTAVAHVLVTQSGPALQPGPRRYTRSWIRDGTTMSAALLRMGRLAEVRAFIEWYVPYQRKDGFVPCCVDREGVDWLVEHDSHGQLIALIWDNHCFAKDKRFLEKLWPAVVRAVKYIQGQREKDGLLPVSVSHEGYLAQPVHSFWDDFWTLRGLRDAVSIAAVLGRNKEKQRWALLAKAMEDSVFAALESTRLTKNLNYIPASREWADFDPTATANAVTLLDAPQAFNEQALTWTFNKYMEDWRRKRKGELPWNNYTAYEIRIIGAMVRLGRRADALELLKFFLSDRRPLEWNQWPEISWADPLSPGHVGDVPHTWIAAEFVLVVRSLFAYESESRDALVLAAGLASEWLDGDGVQVKALPTSFGLLNYRLSQQGKGRCICRVDSGVAVPSGGVVLRPPFGFKRVEVNGKGSTVHKDEVVLMSLPADVVFFR